MITVKFFSSLREHIGIGECKIDYLPSPTLEKVWQLATKNKKLPPNTLCAINMEYAKLTDTAKDLDEIAFFPPVTGG